MQSENTVPPNGDRLLLIEDSLVQAREIASFLESEGYAVDIAASGEEGLEQLKQSRYDLLLCDLHLPGANGFEVCRQVKSLPQETCLPVVLLTRWADPLNVLRGMEAGADGFISKGQRRTEIVHRVRRVIDRSRQAPPTDAQPTRVVFLDAEFELSSQREQLLEVLLAGFEDTVYLNSKCESEMAQRLTAQAGEREKAEELKRSNAELEQYAYIISHDLKEPLRMITSFTNLLEEELRDQLTEDTRRYMTFVTDGAVRMRTMIDDLLEYSRVGRGELNLEPTDLAEISALALENLGVAIRESAAEVQVGELPLVSGAPTLLIRLFQNLIGNAVKFRGERRPEIQVGAEQDGEFWRVFVRDNGIGIEPQHQERIFQVFQRLHRRDQYEGSGIGLAVCRKVVERHGGRLWVESEQNEGSTFWFTFPIADPALIGVDREAVCV